MDVLGNSIFGRCLGACPPIQAGDLNFAAAIVELCEQEARRWTNRPGDALRIPDMLNDPCRELRQKEMI